MVPFLAQIEAGNTSRIQEVDEHDEAKDEVRNLDEQVQSSATAPIEAGNEKQNRGNSENNGGHFVPPDFFIWALDQHFKEVAFSTKPRRNFSKLGAINIRTDLRLDKREVNLKQHFFV